MEDMVRMWMLSCFPIVAGVTARVTASSPGRIGITRSSRIIYERANRKGRVLIFDVEDCMLHDDVGVGVLLARRALRPTTLNQNRLVSHNARNSLPETSPKRTTIRDNTTLRY